MIFNNNRSNIIEMLAEYEENVSRLYSIYAKQFPSYEEFWSKLSIERLDHVRWIYLVGAKINEGSASFDLERLKTEAVQMSLDYLKEQVVRVQKKKVPLINALSIALNIEKSVNGKFFKVFRGYSKDAKQIVSNLLESIEDHYNRIEKIWTEHRKFS